MSETPSQTAATVTITTVRGAARACREASRASKANQEADEVKKRALMMLFEPLLGIKTSDELAAISPEQLKRKITARISSGAVKLEGIDLAALTDAIQKTQGAAPGAMGGRIHCHLTRSPRRGLSRRMLPSASATQ